MIFTWMLGILTIPIIFWCMFLLGLWWLIWATEEESFTGAIWAMVYGTLLGIINFGSFSGFWEGLKSNPFLIIIGFITYLAIGTVWAAFKWKLYVGEQVDVIKVALESGITKQAIAYKFSNRALTEEQILASNFLCLAPDIREFKHKVTTWMVLWVPSSCWFLLNDPIRRSANYIFSQVKGIFQGISDRAFKSAFRVE